MPPVLDLKFQLIEFCLRIIAGISLMVMNRLKRSDPFKVPFGDLR